MNGHHPCDDLVNMLYDDALAPSRVTLCLHREQLSPFAELGRPVAKDPQFHETDRVILPL
jgi:hypothetical protein